MMAVESANVVTTIDRDGGIVVVVVRDPDRGLDRVRRRRIAFVVCRRRRRRDGTIRRVGLVTTMTSVRRRRDIGVVNQKIGKRMY